MSMSELRSLLGLKSTKDDVRIIEAIRLLQAPILLRDFSFKGENIEWTSGPFLSRATKWKDGQKFVKIKLDEVIIDGIKQKYGYTPLELTICNQFKSKYGLKLYEMFVRYYHLPNREGKGVGVVSKSMDELNRVFDTSFKHPSKMKEGLNRGLKEIEKVTEELVNCFYDKNKKQFIFSWHQEEKYPKLRIPEKRVIELIDWYIEHNQEKLMIKSLPKYKQALKKRIYDDTFQELDNLYRGMMKYKYYLDYDIYYVNGKYKDFKNPPKKTLF